MTLIKLSSVLFMSALIFSCKPKPLTSGLKSDSDSSSKHLVFRTDAYVDDSYQFTVEVGPFPADMLVNNQISLRGDLDLCKPGTQVDDVARAVLDEFARVASRAFKMNENQIKDIASEENIQKYLPTVHAVANSVVTQLVGGILRGVNQETTVEVDCNKTIQRAGFTNAFGQVPQEEIFQFSGNMHQIRIPNFRAVVNLSPELGQSSNNKITVSLDKPTLAIVADPMVTADRTCQTFETIKDSNSSKSHKGQLLCFVDPKEDVTNNSDSEESQAYPSQESSNNRAPSASQDQNPRESNSSVTVGGYTCEQQRDWKKCNEPWMTPICDHVCKTL